MRLHSIELYRSDLAFRRPVGTAAGVHRLRPAAFVRVVTDSGDGWGECAALADGTAVDAGFVAVWDELSTNGVSRLAAASAARGGELPSGAQVPALFGSTSVAHLAAAALEMAVLDAELRAAGEPLSRRLGVPDETARTGVPVGRLIGIPEDRSIDALVDTVAEVAPRSARVRLKIEPGWDVEPVRAVRAAFPDLDLQVDANGSYRLDGDGLDGAGRLAFLDTTGLTCIEQPLPPADLVALAQLAARLGTPVALDESLTSLRRLRDAIRYGACEVACIKPARLGGLLRARTAAQMCLDAGVDAFVGGFFETELARTANMALAALPGFTLAGDLSAPGEYLEGGVRGSPIRLVRPYAGAGVGPAPALGAPVSEWRGDEIARGS